MGIPGSLPRDSVQCGELMVKLNKKPEKPYSKPTFVIYGAVQQLTGNVGATKKPDGGTSPFDMTNI
jgi:hypothetical protein